MASLSKYEAYEFKSSVHFVVVQRCVFQTPIEFLQLIWKSIIFGQIGDDLAGAVESQAFAHGLSQDFARIEFQHAHSVGLYLMFRLIRGWHWLGFLLDFDDLRGLTDIGRRYFKVRLRILFRNALGLLSPLGPEMFGRKGGGLE